MRRFFDFRLLGIAMIALALTAAAGSAQSRRNSSEGRLLRDAAARESRGDFSGAEELLRQLLEEDPASSGGLHALERVLRARGETARILPAVDTFLEHEPSSSGVRYLKLRLLMELDSLDELEREAELWFELDEDSEVPYREVARVYERAFGSERALSVLLKGRREMDRPEALALEVGDLHAAMGDREDAVEEWALAVGDDGAQAAAIARRVQGLTEGAEEAGKQLVGLLGESDVLARRLAGARVALDLRLEEESFDLAQSVAADLEERARASFLADVARRAREGDLARTASWAYDELGQDASSPSERRQFDQRIIDVALANGDTATALEAQRRVADSFSPGSVDRRRATAQVIRLESTESDPGRLGVLLRDFRDAFPNAPELDDLAATVAGGLQARGDLGGAAAVLEGIEGPKSGLERGYLLLDAGELEAGRRALLLAIGGLPPTEATDIIQFAGLMGRASETGAVLLAEAGVLAHRGQGAAAAQILAEAAGELEEEERAPLVAEAARIADRAGASGVAASIREILVATYEDTPEFGEASLSLARHKARTPGGVAEAILLLESLIVARPNAAVVPDARLELERLRARTR
ncbi:MAG: hypothetical protein HOD00_01185 [Gemmatimonadales bacterium]|jgi:hypothetical protein|nr:hypothetical protein [Gemmatimonadales bacterium]MDG2240755.1 hypothetical protein [Longimicrobiales bacterium]NCG33087.1 hypothetical protein [Pseudomonadota bacterium]MBT3775522.1 hypothetical protein [Gemmatimonadales bacterium]MBT3957363.1 hypothetical protein [Gemmatimonadales bacterium]